MTIRCRSTINRPDKKWVEAFQKIPTTIASDVMNRMQSMTGAIQPIHPTMKLIGPAITVQIIPGDNSAIHHALSVVQKGDVLVVDGQGSLEIAVFGSILAEACLPVGVAGIVVDGATRDAQSLIDMHFPVFSRGHSPAGPHKGWGGDINVPIACGGVAVHPGDLIIGDLDGVVVVPLAQIAGVFERSLAQIKMEEDLIHAIRRGKKTMDLLGIDQKVEEL